MSRTDPRRPGRILLCLLTAAFHLAVAVPASGQHAAAGLEPPARVAVSPSRLEIDLDDGPGVHSLRLFNFSDEELRVRISVVPWDLDEGNRVRIVEPTEQSLSEWIMLNPAEFTVSPKASQTVRFSIRPRVRPEPGEHRAMIYFEQVLPPSVSERVRVNFKVGVALYGHAGEVERAGTVHAIDVVADADRLAAALDLSSEGNAHVRLRGQYTVWPVDAFPGVGNQPRLEEPGMQVVAGPMPILMAGSLPSTPVLPATRRQLAFRLPHELPPGQYVLGLLGQLGDRELDEGVLFTVPAAGQVQVVAGHDQQD